MGEPRSGFKAKGSRDDTFMVHEGNLREEGGRGVRCWGGGGPAIPGAAGEGVRGVGEDSGEVVTVDVRDDKNIFGGGRE
jgi:hypothetical protein